MEEKDNRSLQEGLSKEKDALAYVQETSCNGGALELEQHSERETTTNKTSKTAQITKTE